MHILLHLLDPLCQLRIPIIREFDYLLLLLLHLIIFPLIALLLLWLPFVHAIIISKPFIHAINPISVMSSLSFGIFNSRIRSISVVSVFHSRP